MNKDESQKMNIYIEPISPKGFNVESHIPEGLKNQEIIELKKISYVDGVVVRNRSLAWRDVLISHVSINAERELQYRLHADASYVEMLFYPHGGSSYALDGAKDILAIAENQHNILFLTSAPYVKNWPTGQNKELISIIISLDLFYRYVPEESMFSDFLRAMDQEQPTALFKRSVTITPQMDGLIRDILAIQQDSLLRRMAMESKVIALLMMQFQQYIDQYQQDKKQYVDAKIQHSMLEAKYYIDGNYTKPASLLDLAHQVGTNEYYLKKYFKQVFGKTVFEYMHEKRMLRARYLLKEEGRNVNEVAQYLGIAEATNFSAAFKKYFGVSPSKLNR